MKTTDNTILVTGGGSGIGRGLAEALHALGNRVIVAGRRQEPLDAVVAANPGVESATLDVADPASVAAFAAGMTERFPELNVLVNCAGISRAEDLAGTPWSLDDVEATVAINLLGPIRLTAALLEGMRRQPESAVLNVSSALAMVPSASAPTYSATKAAIHSWTLSLRHALRDTTTDVIELIPPYVQTELMSPEQASDPHAMPLKDFIDETMALLTVSPTPDEVVVENSRALRHADRDGKFDEIFGMVNGAWG